MIHEGRHFKGRSFAFIRSVSLVVVCCSFIYAVRGLAAAPEKDWTFLVYLNANNSLDSFAAPNIEQMEKIGSTDNINIVVQWAGESNGDTRRMLIQKSTDPNNVTSPIVQKMPVVDMGDYNQLVQFAQWGIQNYPAKHYFLDIWNHGNGWHKLRNPRDLSFDDVSGNHITTQQFGTALSQIAKMIGNKIDIVGTDACMMASVEVTTEVADSVQTFVGSEEVEPGPGWPYDTFLADWVAAAPTNPNDIGKILVEDYVKLYNGSEEVTFSAMDLSHQAEMMSALEGLSSSVKSMASSGQSAVSTAAGAAVHFYLPDYVDLGDFVAHLSQSNAAPSPEALTAVTAAIGDYVVASQTTQQFTGAKGVSIWWPGDSSTYQQYSAAYAQLQFAKTGWNDVLSAFFP